MEHPLVELNDLPQRLLELVEQAVRDGDVVLSRDGKAVARIIPLRRARTPRRPGSARGLIIHMADDFDAIPEDFEQIL